MVSTYIRYSNKTQLFFVKNILRKKSIDFPCAIFFVRIKRRYYKTCERENATFSSKIVGSGLLDGSSSPVKFSLANEADVSRWHRCRSIPTRGVRPLIISDEALADISDAFGRSGARLYYCVRCAHTTQSRHRYTLRDLPHSGVHIYEVHA